MRLVLDVLGPGLALVRRHPAQKLPQRFVCVHAGVKEAAAVVMV
jgi:hypothetical protein